MSPPGRPKGEFRSAKHEGTPVSRTRDRACARARACEWALRLATRVLQA
jgi:hypothetical protein